MKRAVHRADAHLGQFCNQVNAAAFFRHRCDPRRFRSDKITNHPETIPLVAVPSKRGRVCRVAYRRLAPERTYARPSILSRAASWRVERLQNSLLTPGRGRKI